MFAAMGAMLILALATPGAFADDGVLWGLAYLALRLLHAALFALAARGDPALARVVVSLLVSLIPGAGLIIFAGAALRARHRARPLLGGRGRARLRHRARRRHERLARARAPLRGALRADRDHRPRRVDRGHRRRRARRRARRRGRAGRAARASASCARCGGRTSTSSRSSPSTASSAPSRREQVRIARDSYALLHLPMVAGIVLFALGVKKVLEHTGDPLKDMPAFALCARPRALPARARRLPAAQRRLGQLAARRRPPRSAWR